MHRNVTVAKCKYFCAHWGYLLSIRVVPKDTLERSTWCSAACTSFYFISFHVFSYTHPHIDSHAIHCCNSIKAFELPDETLVQHAS